MISQSELLDRAAECARLMSLATDPVKKKRLKQVRDLWIALANASRIMSVPRLLAEIAAIDKMQTGLDPKNTIH